MVAVPVPWSWEVLLPWVVVPACVCCGLHAPPPPPTGDAAATNVRIVSAAPLVVVALDVVTGMSGGRCATEALVVAATDGALARMACCYGGTLVPICCANRNCLTTPMCGWLHVELRRHHVLEKLAASWAEDSSAGRIDKSGVLLLDPLLESCRWPLAGALGAHVRHEGCIGVFDE